MEYRIYCDLEIRLPLPLTSKDALNTYFEWGNRNCLELNASKTKAMMVGSRATLGGIIDPALFNAGNSRILFVKSFVYLGTTLDSELIMETL